MAPEHPARNRAARSRPGWLRAETADPLLRFCLRVADAYAVALVAEEVVRLLDLVEREAVGDELGEVELAVAHDGGPVVRQGAAEAGVLYWVVCDTRGAVDGELL